LQHYVAKHTFRCKECSATFDSSKDLDVHNISSHTFKCNRCKGISFESSVALKKHEETAHTLLCPNCPQRFQVPSELSDHIIETHLLQCKKCPDVYFTSAEAKKEHKCTIDRAPQSQISNAATQTDPPETENSGLNGYASSEASYVTSKEIIAQVYEFPRTEFKEVATQTNIYECEECDAFFEKEEEIELHKNHSPFHGPRALGCTECLLLFPNQIELLRHIESKPHRTRWVLSMI
jgi:uncharacterized C2H2 Zn-finger protein